MTFPAEKHLISQHVGVLNNSIWKSKIQFPKQFQIEMAHLLRFNSSIRWNVRRLKFVCFHIKIF